MARNNNSNLLNRVLGPRADGIQTYTGADIQACIFLPLLSKEAADGDTTARPKFKIFSALHTITISSARSASAVRALGRTNPLAYTRGCIKWTEPIFTNRGLIPVSEIKPGDKILSQDTTTGRVSYEECLGVVNTGIKEVFEVLLVDGSKMSLTADHRVWTNSGYKKVADLTIGDFLYVSVTDQKIDQDVEIQPEVLDLLALSLASQHTEPHTLSLSIRKEKFRTISETIRIMEALGIEYTLTQKVTLNITSLDKKVQAYLETLPKNILGICSNKQLARFLSLLYGLLGSQTAIREKQILLTLPNFDTANRAKLSLARLGIRSTISGTIVSICDPDRLKLLRTLDLSELMPGSDKLLVKLGEKTTYLSEVFHKFLDKYKIPRKDPFSRELTGYSALHYIPEDHKVQFFKESEPHIPHLDITNYPIVSITPGGQHETWDIEVAKNHNLFGGFLSHNSRTWAGTMIFASLDRDAFSDVYQTYIGENTMGDSTSWLFSDQLPPFDILITLANEMGGVSCRMVHGVHLLNYGTTYSMDDLMTEDSFTYVAEAVTPLVAGSATLDLTSPTNRLPSVIDYVESSLRMHYGDILNDYTKRFDGSNGGQIIGPGTLRYTR